MLCLSAVSGLRRNKNRRSNLNTSEALVLRGADCNQLSDIVVGGKDLGQAAVLLCQFWPSGALGDFPVNNAKTVVDLFNQGADIWKKIKDLAKGRPGGTFCWKKAAGRELIHSMMLDAQLQFNRSEMVAASDCDMRVFGRCYGACPSGMKPMAVVGGLVPACTSDCREMTLTRGCGLGCSKGWFSCLGTLSDQVGQVTKAVSKVASFMTGNPLIHEVVDKILRLVDFFIDMMFEVVNVAKKVYREWPRGQAELGVIIALLQFVLEHAKELGQDFLYLKDQFGETLEMIMELMDAEFTWKKIDLDFVANTILKHGKDILDAAFEFATVFVFPTCKAKA